MESITKDKVAEHFKDSHLVCYRNVMTTTFDEGYFKYSGQFDAWVTDLNPADEAAAR